MLQKAIGFIDMMIDYSMANAPLQKELSAGKSLLLFFIWCPIVCFGVIELPFMISISIHVCVHTGQDWFVVAVANG